MTDLDERDVAIDARLRDASQRLREHLALIEVPDRRPIRRHPTRRWLLAAAVIGAVIAGLVAIQLNRSGQSIGNDPARLRWLVTELPDGWKVTRTCDPATRDVPFPATGIRLYATTSGPEGPMLMVLSAQGPSGPGVNPVDAQGLTDIVESTIAGHRAVWAHVGGRRVTFVEMEDRWAVLQSRNISDEDLKALAGNVVIGPDGSASLSSTAPVAGLELMVTPADTLLSFTGYEMDPNVAVSVYVGAAGTYMALGVGERSPAVAASAVLVGDLHAVAFDGGVAYAGSNQLAGSQSPAVMQMLYWEHDGLGFQLSAMGVSAEQLLAAAQSVAPAGPSDWKAASAPPPADTTAAAGTSPAVEGDGAADTTPAYTGEPRDVDADVKVVDVSANEQTWSGTLPDGSAWSVDVVRIYDKISFAPEVNGMSTGHVSGPIERPEGQQIFCCPASVLTRDPKATAFRVELNTGDRVTIALRDLPGANGIRIAVFGSMDVPQAMELVDAGGNVLESFP